MNRQEGYVVLLATNGVRALQLASGHKGAIDLLLTDVEMPGMNGFEVAAALKKLRPATRVLFMSGRDWPAEISDKDFVLKPFRIETLLDKVREILRKGHQ
jgi:two-component system, cell cycle sensor histidine kinase and response regulator CckA